MKDALSILRVKVFDDAEKVEWLQNASISWATPRKNNIMPFDARHELKVMLALTHLIEKRLNKYTYTLSGSSEYIETVGYELTDKQLLGIVLTGEEQRVLHAILEDCVKVADHLTMNR